MGKSLVKLDDKQQVFLKAFALSGDREYAEKKAGMKKGSGHSLLRSPLAKKAIHEIQVSRLTTDALPLAVNAVVEILQDSRSPAAARINAAKLVFDKTVADEVASDKELHEMTPDEINSEIQRLENLSFEDATDVTPGEDEDEEGAGEGPDAWSDLDDESVFD